MQRITPLLVLALLTLCPACRLIGKPKAVKVEPPQGSTLSGVAWRDTLVGSGEPARAGDQLTIEYIASLRDGTKVDATADRGLPFVFRLGMAPVRGWNEGLVGMRAGGKRRLEIPPELAYGSRGIPDLVPPDACMVFEVELLKIAP